MSDAWQHSSTNDAIAPNADEGWANHGRSPSPARNGGGDREMKDMTRDSRDAGARERRSRSRSPVRREDRPDRGRSDGGNNPGNNLHVSGLSTKVDNRELEIAFSKYGKVDKAAIMFDPHTRESRGFGFVTMETVEGADAAIAALNATDLLGKTMTVEKARRGRARTPTPGRYFGPPKRGESDERPYDPRPYDSRYAGNGRDDRRFDDRPPRGGRGYGSGRDPRDDRRYDDRRHDDRRYDDRRERFDDRRYDDRSRYDDRRYDDRRY